MQKKSEYRSESEFEQEKEKEKTEPRILDLWNEWRKKAPIIESKHLPTIEELALQEGVEISSFEEHIFKRINTWIKQLETKDQYTDDEDVAFAEMLYVLYRRGNASSLEEFLTRYCPDASEYAQSMISKVCQYMSEMLVNTRRVIKVGTWHPHWKAIDGRRKVYEGDGTWVVMPHSEGWYDSESGYEFVDASVLQEILVLLESGYQRPDYSHATGSAALPGIAQQKAILSMKESLQRDQKIKTGEYVTKTNKSYGRLKKDRGCLVILDSVYVDLGSPRFGYNTLNWFDEYFVTFGIDKARQEAFLQTTDFRYNKYTEEDEGDLSYDYGSEGYLIGHIVPLESVTVVYGLKKHENELKEWMTQHCPHASFISLEASQVLSNYGRAVNSIALQEEVDPKEIWKTLLQ